MPVKERCFLQGITRVCTRTRHSRGVTYPTENRVSIQKPKTISLRRGSVSSPARCAPVLHCQESHLVLASNSSVSIWAKMTPSSDSHFREDYRLLNCSRLHVQRSAGLFGLLHREEDLPNGTSKLFSCIIKIRRKNTIRERTAAQIDATSRAVN